MSFKFGLKRKVKGFTVRLRSYSLEDRQVAGKEHLDYVEKILPESDWGRYGFTQQMTYDEALTHIRSLNSQSKLRAVQERRAKFKQIENEQYQELLESAHLPEYIVREFEKKLENDSFAADYTKSKTYFHWKTAMKVIAEIEIPPGEWSDSKRTILKKIEGYAPSTVSKLLSLINAYGMFYSKKMGKFYDKITTPRGVEVGRLSDKYMDKTGGRTKEAKGITLAGMNKVKHSELTPGEKNWCIVCLGFGLRPAEMKLVIERDNKTFIMTSTSVKIYQSKLVSLPKPFRFKEVIIKHPFQKEAQAIVKANKDIKQPSIHMLRKVLGEDYGLYSFRKGYSEIMINLGEPIERISFDLGHSSIERTWKSYRKRISQK